MAPGLQRAAAFVGIADRIRLRAEEVPVQDAKMRLPGLGDRAPGAGTAAPGAVGMPDGINAGLRRLAADRLIGHVVDAARAARNEYIPDHALVVDAEGRAVDVVAEVSLSSHLELQQRRALRVRR